MSPRLTDTQRGALRTILDELRETAGADRTTVRVDFEGFRFPVVAESLAPGMESIADDQTFDLRTAPSSRAVLQTRVPLVQENCAEHEFAPPPEFIRLYDVRAQVLGPLVRDNRVIGIISVHSRQPRRWSDADLAALDAAVARSLQVVTG